MKPPHTQLTQDSQKSRRIQSNLCQRNPANIPITREDVEKILQTYGVTEKINDLQLYQTAMVHKSYLKTAQQTGAKTIQSDENDGSMEPFDTSYERLELIGDAVLGSAIVTYIYLRYSDLNEGGLTKLKTRLVRDKTCAMLCVALGLPKFFVLSQSLDKMQNSRENYKIQEDVFEAFLGAMYIDFGGLNLGHSGHATEICQKFIVKLYEENINFAKLLMHDDNYKDQLLRYYQRNFNGQHPKYTIISETGPTNNRVYVMGVMDANCTLDSNGKLVGEIIGIGKAGKKNEAEQIASKKALEHFGINTD